MAPVVAKGRRASESVSRMFKSCTCVLRKLEQPSLLFYFSYMKIDGSSLADHDRTKLLLVTFIWSKSVCTLII